MIVLAEGGEEMRDELACPVRAGARRPAVSEAPDEDRLAEDLEEERLILQGCREELSRMGEDMRRMRAELDGMRSAQEAANRSFERKQSSLNQALLGSLQEGGLGRRVRDMLGLFDARADMLPALRESCPRFVESMILENEGFGTSSILRMSRSIPFQTYVEYALAGYGGTLTIYLAGVFGSRCLVEEVADGRIVKQDAVVLERDGPYQLAVPSLRGRAFVRFRTLDPSSIVRVLEISDRRFGWFAKDSLAACIT